MAGIVSKSPNLFIAVLQKGRNVISRFCPGRSEVETVKPTVHEKKQIPKPPQ